jgi:hypothetical protein
MRSNDGAITFCGSQPGTSKALEWLREDLYPLCGAAFACRCYNCVTAGMIERKIMIGPLHARFNFSRGPIDTARPNGENVALFWVTTWYTAPAAQVLPPPAPSGSR